MFFIKSKAEKKLSKEDIKLCTEQMLSEDFPDTLFVISAIVNILLGFLAIVIDIISIVDKSPLYYVGTGYYQESSIWFIYILK